MIDRELTGNFDAVEEWNGPDFCKYCSFYECELVGEYTQFRNSHSQIVDQTNADSSGEDIFSYIHSELENGCTMGRRYVNQVECGRQNVTEGIGDHFKIEIDDKGIKENITDRWEPLQPVFISAQTGQGKNYFIENTLIPYVRELNYKNQTNNKVLILSNRLALKQQTKNHLNGNDDSDDEDNCIYFYKEVADVMTYQSLLQKEGYLKNKQKNVKERYIYVICDEAHFFTSDAMFNPHTERILLAIVHLFKDAIRVYMSATPYVCLEYINKYEENYRKWHINGDKPQYKWKGGKMVLYHFTRDYSYLDIKAYSSINELYEDIVSTVSKKKEKWLIFIDDKKKCGTIKANLNRYAKKIQSSFESKNTLIVDAGSKKDPAYQEIISKEKLSKDIYVLIATSVLDNGINLTGITHIVVSDMDKVKCLQMVGRARLDPKGKRKTLYIKRFATDEINRQMIGLKKQQDAYHSYEMAYGGNQCSKTTKNERQFLSKYYDGKEEDWKDAKRWFGREWNDPVKLYVNGIARSLLDKLIYWYGSILDEMAEENSQKYNKSYGQKGKRFIGQRYLEHQFSWFGKEYCEENEITFDIIKKRREEFIDFLNCYAEREEEKKRISEDEQEEFRKEFTKLFDKAFGRKDRNKDRIYKINKMNKILKEEAINYEIKSVPDGWIVQKHCREMEEDI